jgi:hypothetical protein
MMIIQERGNPMSHKRSRPVLGALRLSALMVALILSAVGVNAQVSGGSISGRVTDPSGAVIPNAQISIENASTGNSRQITTNNEGFFSAPDLQAGTYNVTASAAGFKRQVRQLSVSVGTAQLMDLTLTIGDASEHVEVSGAGGGVDLTTSTIAQVIDEKTIVELPLNGRSWTDLASLQPGVVPVRTEMALPTRAQHGFGTELTISGGRPQQNTYRLNGISINDFSNAAPGSVLGIAMGVDAIQEFSVLTSNYSAEYGRTSGGVVNAVTRSGQNQLHGSAYEFLRNSALDARNYFDKTIPPFKRNQFGGSIGGPIVKDKTFFFADYEGLRQSLGQTKNAVVPSASARAGNLAGGKVTVDPAVARFISAFYPLPNGPSIGNGDTGNYTVAGQQITPENFWTVRGDHKFSPNDSINLVYLNDSSNTSQPDEFNAKRIALTSGQKVVTVEAIHTFTTQLLNSLRLGYTRSRGEDGDVTDVTNPAMSDPSYGFVPGLTAGSLTVTGLTEFTGGANGTGVAPHKFLQNSYQVHDDLVWSKGSHVFKFGGNVERLQHNSLISSWPGSRIGFTSLSNFLTNKPTSITAVIDPAHNLTERGVRQAIFGAYVQDDWRWHRNLTLNLGLRYEASTVPSEEHGKLATLINITDTAPHLGDPYFSNPTLHNFEPRIGLAWDPFGDQKTSVRAAFGMFDVLPLPYIFQILTPFSAPFFLQVNASGLPAGSFPTGAYQSVAANPNALRVSYIDPHPKRNYVMVWNLNVERELTSHVSATAAYVGSHGVHQPFTNNDADMVLPTLTPQGYVWPSKATSQRINPSWGRIALKLFQTSSSYSSLQTGLVAHTHNLQMKTSYTWAKSIDDSSASEADNSFANTIGNPLWFAPRTNRGRSDFDIRHNLAISTLWRVPNESTWNSHFAETLLNGWSVGGIYSFNTGAPFNVFVAGDPLGTKGNGPAELPNRVQSAACQDLTTGNPLSYVKVGCFTFLNPTNVLGSLGRNNLTGPSLSNLDFSILKDNFLGFVSDRLNVQFRVEAFNVLNHTNFAPPINNSTIFDASGNLVNAIGRIDTTQTPSRQIQFGLKFVW